MKTITITFIMDPFTFTYIWSKASKKGGQLNEFLIDYYIEEIAEHFPKSESVIPKIFLTAGDRYSLLQLLMNPKLEEIENYRVEKLIKNFFVAKNKIINPIEVGI